MRTAPVCALFSLLTLCVSKAQAPHGQASLQTEVAAIAAQHHGHVSLFAENLRTHEVVSLAPDTVVQTASIIKLAILYEALEQMRAGKLHMNDSITMQPADEVPGSGVLHLLDAPMTLTFKDVLTLMIVMSDNAAANLAMDHVGIEKVDARMSQLGLRDTYLYKKVFTPAPAGTALPADQKRFGLGKTTAKQMASLMTKIVTCDLGAKSQPDDAPLCQAAVRMLQVQFYRNAIPRYLDDMPGATGSSIANKTGSLEAVRNDVAAVSTRNGMVVIAAFTFDNADRSWGAEQEGELTIAKLARAIVQRWSPDGLAAWPVTPPGMQGGDRPYLDNGNIP